MPIEKEPEKCRITKKELEDRRRKLDYTGWDTNIFHLNPDSIFEVESGALDELWINIIDPSFVSKPCWKELLEASNSHKNAEVIFDGELFECHVFVFDNEEKAKRFALRVQSSARNIRKDETRRWHQENAEGYHTNTCLDQLFEIQQGRCYYSGDLLIKNPKNYSKDHIISLYSGGSEWPENLALSLKHINTWKGNVRSKQDTLNWLAQERGENWKKEQLVFCAEVDRLRAIYNYKFRMAN